jgi:hypothetical protein
VGLDIGILEISPLDGIAIHFLIVSIGCTRA